MPWGDYKFGFFDVPISEQEKLTIYDVPQIGKWVGRVGHVIDVIGTPCAGATFEIGILAAWYNLPKLVLALVKPDSMDLVTQRWGGRHSHRRKKRMTLLEHIAPKDPIPKGMGWAWFSVLNAAEKVGWYVLVVDATTEFAVNWTSTAFAMAGCKTHNAAYCRMEIQPGDYGPYAAGTYMLSGFNVVGEHIFAGDSNSISVQTGYNSSVTFALQTQPLIGPFQQCEVTGVEIIDLVHNQVMWQGGVHQGYENKSYASGLVRDWGAPIFARDWGIRYTKTDGFFNPTGSFFSCYGDKSTGLVPDP